MDRGRWVAVRAGVIALTTVVSAAVLCARQTPEALLRTGSYVEALVGVLLFGGPGFAAYLLMAWSRPAVAVAGSALAGMTVWAWWGAATDTHSTASLGPGITGWIFAPAAVAAIVAADALVRLLWARCFPEDVA